MDGYLVSNSYIRTKFEEKTRQGDMKKSMLYENPFLVVTKTKFAVSQSRFLRKSIKVFLKQL